MTSKKFIENLTQSERKKYRELGIPLAVAAKFEVRPETNFPIPTSDCHGYDAPVEAYEDLIDAISGKGTFAKNPWVYVYNFKLVK